MPDNCKHWQALTAEHALAPDHPIDAALDAHLSTCAECASTLAEFRATAAALAHATEPRATTMSSASVPAGLEHRIMTRLYDARREQRTRRTRRTVLALIGAAAAAIALVVTLASIRDPAAPVRGDRVTLAASDVRGDATLEPRAWGTEIHLTASGFTAGQQYNLWLERADGSHVPAGTFTGVTATKLTVTLASALPTADAIAIGISRPDGTLIVRTALS